MPTQTQLLLPAGTVMCCDVRNTTGPFAKTIFSLLAYYSPCSTEPQQDFLVSSCLRYILTVIILYKSTAKCWTARILVHLRIWESQLLSQAPVTLGLGEKNSPMLKKIVRSSRGSICLNFQTVSGEAITVASEARQDTFRPQS